MTQYFWDDAAFASRVKAAADQNGESVADLLRRAGLDPAMFDQSSVAAVAKGRADHIAKTGRSAGTIFKIATVTGLTPQELFAAGVGGYA